MSKGEKRIYAAAPLPFQGQKRHVTKELGKILEEAKTANKVLTIVDLFGGSGLLSHTAKRMFPDLRVIYNDYDDFNVRLGNIDKTNSLIANIRGIVGDYPREKKMSADMRYRILGLIRESENKGDFVDYITLSSSLLFSGNYAMDYKGLEKKSAFYNNVKLVDYSVMGYMDGIEVVKYDYMDLFNLYKDNDKVLFLIDPPYLSTNISSYKCDYWKMKDYIGVLTTLCRGGYVYFTSSKSYLVDLCESLEDIFNVENPLVGAGMITYKRTVNESSKYTDMMFYKV